MDRLELLNEYLEREEYNAMCYKCGSADRSNYLKRIKIVEEIIALFKNIESYSLPLADGTEYEMPNEVFLEYKALYPMIDVGAELKLMRAWLVSNPDKKKKRVGILRFINTWLAYEFKAVAKNIEDGRKSACKAGVLNNYKQDLPDFNKITDELLKRQLNG